MTQKERYEAAKEMYAKLGVDTDAAIAKLKEIPVSLHCWQGDDVIGFDHDAGYRRGARAYAGKEKAESSRMLRDF